LQRCAFSGSLRKGDRQEVTGQWAEKEVGEMLEDLSGNLGTAMGRVATHRNQFSVVWRARKRGGDGWR